MMITVTNKDINRVKIILYYLFCNRFSHYAIACEVGNLQSLLATFIVALVECSKIWALFTKVKLM